MTSLIESKSWCKERKSSSLGDGWREFKIWRLSLRSRDPFLICSIMTRIEVSYHFRSGVEKCLNMLAWLQPTSREKIVSRSVDGWRKSRGLIGGVARTLKQLVGVVEESSGEILLMWTLVGRSKNGRTWRALVMALCWILLRWRTAEVKTSFSWGFHRNRFEPLDG